MFFFFLKKKDKILSFRKQRWQVFVCNSRTKEHHVDGYKYIVKEELTCTIDDDSKRSSNAIKVPFRDYEMKKNKRNIPKVSSQDLPEHLVKILYPVMKAWRILSMKTFITGEKRRPPENTWVAGGEIIPLCLYHIYAARTHKIYIREKLETVEKINILSETQNLLFSSFFTHEKGLFGDEGWAYAWVGL